MRTYITYPSLARPTGGMMVLVDVARSLTKAGYPTYLVCREEKPDLPDPAQNNLHLLEWDEAKPGREDIWLVPEGWPGLLMPGLRSQARTTVYVQNWAYLLSSLPQGTEFRQLGLRLIAVSQPVAWHARKYCGLEPEILRPGIDLSLFHPAPAWQSGMPLESGRPVRIAWMPRKNKALAAQIQQMINARLTMDDSFGSVEWVSIHHNTRGEVAEILRCCHVFLATGFPEGCPLPPLEAMACGCIPVGFSGFGGWDYMKQAMPGGWQPWWPSRPDEEKPWKANGFFASDADTVAAADALEYVLGLLRKGGQDLKDVQLAGLATASAYSREEQERALLALWERAASGIALA